MQTLPSTPCIFSNELTSNNSPAQLILWQLGLILFPRLEMPNNISKLLAFSEHAICITNTSKHSFGELVDRLQLSLLTFSLTKTKTQNLHQEISKLPAFLA
jgi:hypothetical protein